MCLVTFPQELQNEGETVDEVMEDEFYLRRLDAGLFSLQLIDCIIMEVCSSGVASVSYKRTKARSIHLSHRAFTFISLKSNQTAHKI